MNRFWRQNVPLLLSVPSDNLSNDDLGTRRFEEVFAEVKILLLKGPTKNFFRRLGFLNHVWLDDLGTGQTIFCNWA